MRDFQAKSNVGALPDSNSATKLGGGEATSLRTENKNAVSRAGLTLAPQDGTGEDTTQLAQGSFINGTKAQHFQDGGAVNAIALTPVSGASGVVLPPDYTTLDGAHFTFFAAFTTTSATVTLSIGQTGGTQFGTKAVILEDGTDPAVGDIDTITENEVVYDAGPDKFILVRAVGVGAQQFANQSTVDAGTEAAQSIAPNTLKGNLELRGLWANSELIAGDLDLFTNTQLHKAGKYSGTGLTNAPLSGNNVWIVESLPWYNSTAGSFNVLVATNVTSTAVEPGTQFINVADGAGAFGAWVCTSGCVAEVSTRSTTGIWTIPGLIIGKPLILTVEGIHASNNGAAVIKVTAGAQGGSSIIAADYFTIAATNLGTTRASSSMIIIPTATSVSIDVNSVNSGGAFLRAYQ